jgi:cation transport protein ChaC
VDRSHPQYAGGLSLEEQLRLVQQGHGRSGANPEYVVETVKHMRALGIRDAALEWLAERL